VVEIEVKARLVDFHATEAKVASWAKFAREFDKFDAYFVTADYNPNASTGFRLRIRSDEGKHFVSHKIKTIQSGIETNEEIEFEIGDPEAFVFILEKLGAIPDLRKRKTGRSYLWEGLTIELCRVEGLGDFIEIESLDSVRDLKDIAAYELESAREKLLKVLDKAGVERGFIELKSWGELLKGR
jgi:adenylate cyclase class 2